MREKECRIIAHRGFWDTPGGTENSLASLEMAGRIGAYGSEFDVHLTADNVAVVHHDHGIQGIAIQEVPYDALKDCRLANGEKLPTLERYLERAAGMTLRLILEVKPHATPERNREAAALVVDMARRFGLEDRTEYITFDRDAGGELIRLAPGRDIAFLAGDDNAPSPGSLKDLGYTGLDYHVGVMQRHPEYFPEAREAGVTINVWTVDSEADMRDMIEKGADFLTTNKPLLAQRLVSGQREFSW